VNGVAWSADGKKVVSCSQGDKGIRVWDVGASGSTVSLRHLGICPIGRGKAYQTEGATGELDSFSSPVGGSLHRASFQLGFFSSQLKRADTSDLYTFNFIGSRDEQLD
jgi:WD40 repeat protein